MKFELAKSQLIAILELLYFSLLEGGSTLVLGSTKCLPLFHPPVLPRTSEE